jgi:radical SAM superfamily enzyme YgiQ (UPF0313 family)
MVFPRFNPRSFWSLKATCKAHGASAVMPPLGLMTVAALLPKDWTVRLVDRNVHALKHADISWADLVMVGGMIVQRPDALEVLALCRRQGKPVVCGGPDTTSSPEAYADADVLVLGEAEGVIDAFVVAWESGQRRGRFAAPKFTIDVTKTPVPRFDLIDRHRYLYLGVQFSRGCPFNCEFCDIIELYGRVPRPKAHEQMLAELQALYDLGHRGHVDFVDDNLIGNKKALKQFLPGLARWQAERRFPFMFSTEASINLADDSELLDMMARANFFLVFVGIESPDTETLVAARKKQNTRRSLVDSVRRINAAGMIVAAGFIVGFDTEGEGVAEAMIELIEAAAIPVCMVGLLTALPNTQLSRRLAREGRLLDRPIEAAEDQCTGGLNFVPRRPRRAILEDYRRIVAAIYQPQAYFDRVVRFAQCLERKPRGSGAELLRDRTRRAMFRRLALAMMFTRWRAGRLFWRNLIRVARENPAALEFAIIQMAIYLHLGSHARYVEHVIEQQIADLVEEHQSVAA